MAGPRVSFARDLERHGDHIAVTSAEGRITYRELAARADAFARDLGDIPRLIVIEGSNRPEPLVAYLGALRAGHPVILTAPGAATQPALMTAYAPDFAYVLRGDSFHLEDHRQPSRSFHPDLALMLSTSGTTGSAKLVRLSSTAVQANAQSIAEYLALTSDDRPITSLPFHYSYGLSVVNSHLLVGANILLTESSVIDPAFWTLASAEGATSLAGVPYTYELLERAGFRERPHATLITLTQAGGRLPVDLVTSYATWAQTSGARFFVMYGQTEATARMAYLPPDRCLQNAGAIGVAIPGGSFELLDDAGRIIDQPDVVGELVYAGPNVMMGYAEEALDLARGADITELRTGDLASRDAAGLYRISGRKSRFAKVFGLRINLDDVEASVASGGSRGAAVSDDRIIAIGVLAGAAPASIAERLAAAYKLPSETFVVVAYADLPTLPSGKIDYRRILADALASHSPGGAAGSEERLDAIYARIFHLRAAPDDSFVSLGGDSLNYVVLSLEVEACLGFLPSGWEELTLAELQALAPRTEREMIPGFRPLDTEIAIRALAIMAVVINHVSSLVVGGGAEVLLLLAGYNLARYQRRKLFNGRGPSVLGSLVVRIILPYYIFLLIYLVIKHRVDVPSLLMVSNYVGRWNSMIEPFWFLEALLQCTAIFVLIMAVAPVRWFAERDPWTFGLGLLASAVGCKVAVAAAFDIVHLRDRTADAVFFLLALGWCVQQASTRVRKGILSVVVVAFALLDLTHSRYWQGLPAPASTSHAIWLSVSTLMILWVPRVQAPRLAHPVITTIAAASFYIYLTHVVPVDIIFWTLHQKSLALNLGAALAVGIAAWWGVQKLDLSLLGVARRFGWRGDARSD